MIVYNKAVDLLQLSRTFRSMSQMTMNDFIRFNAEIEGLEIILCNSLFYQDKIHDNFIKVVDRIEYDNDFQIYLVVSSGPVSDEIPLWLADDFDYIMGADFDYQAEYKKVKKSISNVIERVRGIYGRTFKDQEPRLNTAYEPKELQKIIVEFCENEKRNRAKSAVLLDKLEERGFLANPSTRKKNRQALMSLLPASWHLKEGALELDWSDMNAAVLPTFGLNFSSILTDFKKRK